MTAAPGAVTSHLGQMGGAQQSQSGQGNVAEQDLIAVPAGLFSGLLAGLAGNIGGAVGGLFGQGRLGQQIGEGARPFIEMIPFSVIPAGVGPQTAQPQTAQPQGAQPQGAQPQGGAQATGEDLVLVPAGLFSGLLGGLARTISPTVGEFFGSRRAGQQAGQVAGSLIEMLPFSTVPSGVSPASAGRPDGQGSAQPQRQSSGEDLVLVPAGLFSGLLAGLAGGIGGVAGGLFGQRRLGQQIGEGARPFIEMLPFSVIPAGAAR